MEVGKFKYPLNIPCKTGGYLISGWKLFSAGIAVAKRA